MTGPDTELKIWAAGAFDGEGSALIEKTGPNSYSIVVAVVNSDNRFTERFHKNWGGTYRNRTGDYLGKHSHVKPRKEVYYILYFDHREARRLLTDVYPYLIIKQEAVNTVLRALLLLPEQRTVGSNGRKRVPRGTTALLKPYYEELKRLSAGPQISDKSFNEL